MKVSKYKLNLFFNIFPSYSISAWVSSIFVQPRLFALPFLITKNFTFRLNKWNFFLLINLLIAFFTPLFGFFFDRTFYYLDFAYILSSIYAFFFINTVVSTEKNIKLFNDFLHLTLMLNFWYILLQLFFYYTGLSQFTMIHSNVPFHVNSGYTIEPGVISFIPRYTGLWIESGPLAFFLCLSFPYIIQKGVNFPGYLKLIVFILILFSQSKFLLIFIPVLFLEFIIKKVLPRFYRLAIKPFFVLLVLTILIASILIIIFADFQFHKDFSKEIPAYELRLNGLRSSISSIPDLGPFGKGLLPSTIELKGVKFALQGSDAFSIIFLGYGLYPGSIMLLSILLIPVFSNLTYKYTFCAIIIFGFLSSGSLIVPQYLFAIAYAIVGHYQNRIFKQSH
jgi:hypothetical protein